jgi:hypothetical protein
LIQSISDPHICWQAPNVLEPGQPDRLGLETISKALAVRHAESPTILVESLEDVANFLMLSVPAPTTMEIMTRFLHLGIWYPGQFWLGGLQKWPVGQVGWTPWLHKLAKQLIDCKACGCGSFEQDWELVLGGRCQKASGHRLQD